MHDEVFFKECFQCQRQETYEVKGVKDNYFKCRIKNHVFKIVYNGIKECPYFKRRLKDGEDSRSY